MEEEQFILRLPPPLAAHLRKSLSKSKRNVEYQRSVFTYTINEDRSGLFTCDGKQYPAKLMDLPCIVESHKTADRRTFYKSSDIHQVLVVRMPGEPAPEDDVLSDGLSKGAKGARERVTIAEGDFTREEVAKVENRIKYVLDAKVQFVRKKSNAAEAEAEAEEQEIVIEEEGVEKKQKVSPEKARAPGRSMPSASGAGASSHGSAGVPGAETTLSPSPGPQLASSVAKAPLVSSAVPAPPISSAPAGSLSPSTLPAPSPPIPSPPVPSPASSQEQSPPAVAEEVEEVEDEEDFMSAWAEEMLEPGKDDDGAVAEEREHANAMKRIERANLERKIDDQKKMIAQQTELAERMPNPIMKQRLLGKRDELQLELSRLEQELAKLG